MDIGTAKPSSEEKEAVKHHLIDIITPDDSYDAGRFVKDTEKLIQEIQHQDKIPIIVGGTGFYFKSLMEGLSSLPPIPIEIRQSLAEEMKSSSSEEMYLELQKVDSVIAERTHPNDGQRILRALEVFRATGIPLSRHWENKPEAPDFKILNVLLLQDRQILYSKINNRMDSMLSKGLLEEIDSILKKGYDIDCPGMKTLGYREFLPYLSGVAPLDECVIKAKQNSRNYAKRQLTWYRKQNFHLTFTMDEVTLSHIFCKIFSNIRS